MQLSNALKEECRLCCLGKQLCLCCCELLDIHFTNLRWFMRESVVLLRRFKLLPESLWQLFGIAVSAIPSLSALERKRACSLILHRPILTSNLLSPPSQTTGLWSISTDHVVFPCQLSAQPGLRFVSDALEYVPKALKGRHIRFGMCFERMG